jgi:uridine kinase
MTSRKSLLTEIAKRLVDVFPDRTIRVAVDGVDGAGKTTFADELGASVSALGRPTIRASVDSFHNPKAVRYRQGRHSPKGFFEDSYNYVALKRFLLDPLGPAGSQCYQTAAFDHRLDKEVSAVELKAQPSSVLLVDGIFLHRPELLQYWDVSIFLQVAFAQSVARCAERDGWPPDPKALSNRRYVGGQRLYLERCQPASKATIVIDNNDFSSPALVTPV